MTTHLSASLNQSLSLIYEVSRLISACRTNKACKPVREDLATLKLLEEKSHMLWISICALERGIDEEWE